MKSRKAAPSLIVLVLLGLAATGAAFAQEPASEPVTPAGTGSAPGTIEVPLPPLASIDDLAWAPASQRRLLISSDGAAPFHFYDTQGEAVEELYVPLTRVRDVQVLPDGSTLFGDGRNGRIYHVGSDGALIASAGARGLEEGQFLQLEMVARDGQGGLFGLDASEYRVHQYSPAGEYQRSYSLAAGPVLDSSGRLVAVQESLSNLRRKIVALSADGAETVLYEAEMSPETRWEPIAGLADGAVLVRQLDGTGSVAVARVRPGGESSPMVELAADAILAGPARVIAVSPEGDAFVYLAGGPEAYRAIWNVLP